MNDLHSSTRRRLLAAIGGGIALGMLPLAPLQAAGVQPVSLPDRVDLGVAFGRLGPALLISGAIDAERFATTYRNAGQPLDDQQLQLLHEGSTANVIFDRDNAYFLLNFFWALGLTNASPILTAGPMMQGGLARVSRFASTGGWTLGKRPAITLYSSTPVMELTPVQQERVWEVSAGVYRPCCGNPTSFPDCNHGTPCWAFYNCLRQQTTAPHSSSPPPRPPTDSGIRRKPRRLLSTCKPGRA